MTRIGEEHTDDVEKPGGGPLLRVSVLSSSLLPPLCPHPSGKVSKFTELEPTPKRIVGGSFREVRRNLPRAAKNKKKRHTVLGLSRIFLPGLPDSQTARLRADCQRSSQRILANGFLWVVCQRHGWILPSFLLPFLDRLSFHLGSGVSSLFGVLCVRSRRGLYARSTNSVLHSISSSDCLDRPCRCLDSSQCTTGNRFWLLCFPSLLPLPSSVSPFLTLAKLPQRGLIRNREQVYRKAQPTIVEKQKNNN